MLHTLHTVVYPQLAPVPGVHFGQAARNPKQVGYFTGHWAGYHAEASSNGNPGWWSVTTDMYAFGERAVDWHHLGSWIGFGGTASDNTPLTQAGLDLYDDGSYSFQGKILFFWEYVNPNCSPGGSCGTNYAQDITNVSVSAGDHVYMQIFRQNNVSYAYLDNETTGNGTEVPGVSNGGTFSNSSAEWEFEDASGQSGNMYYPTATFRNCIANNSSGTDQYGSNLNTIADWMGSAGGPYYVKVGGWGTPVTYAFQTAPQQ